MDYENINKVADYYHKEIFPRLQYLLNPPVSSLIEVMQAYEKYTKTCPFISLKYPHAYRTIKFMDKFKENCLFYIHPADPNQGNLRIYYYFPKSSLYIELNPLIFTEEKQVICHGFLTGHAKNYEEFLKFSEKISSLIETGEEYQEKELGFRV